VRFSPSIDGDAVRRGYGFAPQDLVIGWSGVVRAWHGLDLLVKVLAIRPSMKLLIIGDGPDRDNIERAAASLGVAGRIRFAGQVPRDQVAEQLAAIDVGAVADDRTGYASPMKLVEYMAMGKPVVAPDLANIRDILTGGREGLLFAPGDPGSMASCLDELTSPVVRAEIGLRARGRVLQELNWLAHARTIVDAVAGMGAPRAMRAN
jgi:glycosyltransferase involved in cell wall biosynthesis